jgi:hypothetical protein
MAFDLVGSKIEMKRVSHSPDGESDYLLVQKTYGDGTLVEIVFTQDEVRYLSSLITSRAAANDHDEVLLRSGVANVNEVRKRTVTDQP